MENVWGEDQLRLQLKCRAIREMRHLPIANVALVREGFPRLHIRHLVDVSPHLLLRESEAESGSSRSTQHVRNAVRSFLQTLLQSSLVLPHAVRK